MGRWLQSQTWEDRQRHRAQAGSSRSSVRGRWLTRKGGRDGGEARRAGREGGKGDREKRGEDLRHIRRTDGQGELAGAGGPTRRTDAGGGRPTPLGDGLAEDCPLLFGIGSWGRYRVPEGKKLLGLGKEVQFCFLM